MPRVAPQFYGLWLFGPWHHCIMIRTSRCLTLLRSYHDRHSPLPMNKLRLFPLANAHCIIFIFKFLRPYRLFFFDFQSTLVKHLFWEYNGCQGQKPETTMCLHRSGFMALWPARYGAEHPVNVRFAPTEVERRHKSGTSASRYANIGQNCGVLCASDTQHRP